MLVLLIFIVIGAVSVAVNNAGEKIVWDDIILGDMLPIPPKGRGEIYSNSVDRLSVEVKNISDKQYADYVEECKETGFIIDAKTSSSSYNAYNADGYKLSLSHYDDISIRLETPMEMSTITWPTGTAGQLLPIPKSTKGSFAYEYDDNFRVYIGDMTKADYNEYVTACAEKGFHVDYNKGEDYYYADNSDGWYISLRYEGFNIVSIDIDAPNEEENTTESVAATTKGSTTEAPVAESTENIVDSSVAETSEAKNETTQDAAVDSNAIDSDFKAAMDSYENFITEYVEFIKKYSENPSDFSLLADYVDYMSKYAKFVEEFEDWEDEDMNVAETAYYIDVQARVSKKLLEITY